ncbi:hypothetical protein G6F46_015179 [Rhizopus delemar]|nr:hypothetical protein G6F46_015179 [Rhizopus delemar]
MHVGTTQLLGGHHFASGRLHQRRAAQEDGALVLHDDGFIAHGGHVGAAGGWGQQAAFGQRFQIPVGGGARALQMRHNVFLERGGGAVAKEGEDGQHAVGSAHCCWECLVNVEAAVDVDHDAG